jgi:protein subunit release factor B
MGITSMEQREILEHLLKSADWSTSRSSGPGGQHRDKASTRVVEDGVLKTRSVCTACSSAKSLRQAKGSRTAPGTRSLEAARIAYDSSETRCPRTSRAR